MCAAYINGETNNMTYRDRGLAYIVSIVVGLMMVWYLVSCGVKI